MGTSRTMLGLRRTGSLALSAGCVAFHFASVLTLVAQPANPVPPTVQLPTPITVAYNFSPATNYVPFLGYTNQEGAFCTAHFIQVGAGRLYGVAPSGGGVCGGPGVCVAHGRGDF